MGLWYFGTQILQPIFTREQGIWMELSRTATIRSHPLRRSHPAWEVTRHQNSISGVENINKLFQTEPQGVATEALMSKSPGGANWKYFDIIRF